MRVLLVRYGVLLSGLTGICLLSGCSPRAAADATENKQAAVSTPTSLPSPATLQVSGTLAPMSGTVIKISATTPGRLTGLSVQEGDHVRIGQILATIATIPVEATKSPIIALTRLPVAVMSDQGDATETARLALLAARIERDHSVKQAETNLDTAEKEREKVTAGAKPEEIEQAQQAITDAEKKRDKVIQILERDRRLFSKGFLPKRTVDKDEIALTAAESELTAASDAQKQLKNGAHPEEIKLVNLRLQVAGDALNAAKEAGDTKVSRLEEQIKQIEDKAKERVEKRRKAELLHRLAQQKRLELAEKPLMTTLRSPIDGVILKRQRKPGEKLLPGTTILEVADTHLLNLTTPMSEEQSRFITEGISVNVTSAEIPQQVFPGTVSKISVTEGKGVRVEITVRNEDKRLKPGDKVVSEFVAPASASGGTRE